MIVDKFIVQENEPGASTTAAWFNPVTSELKFYVNGQWTGLKDEDTPYELPAATANALGGVKVGKGLTIDTDGTLDVSIPAYYDFGNVSYTGAVAGAIRVPLTDEQLNDLLASNKLAINLNIHIEDEYEGTPFEDSVELNGIYSFIISGQTISIFVGSSYTDNLEGSESYIHVGLSLDTTEGSSAFVLTPGII